MGVAQPALLFFILASIYVLLDIVRVPFFLESFTNTALVTLIVLLLCSLALERSQIIHFLSKKIISKNQSFSLLRLMGISSFLSAFINNTAVVAAFLGTVLQQKNIAPSKLLIPLSYASILGGITTLIGTSTNLVINSFLIKANLEPLSMFSFSLVGIPVAIGAMVVIYFNRNSFPDNGRAFDNKGESYFLTAQVEAGYEYLGKAIKESGLTNLDGLYLIEIIRSERLISPVSQNEPLLEGDKLVFVGKIDNFQLLQPSKHLTLLGGNASDLLTSNLVEVVISNQSELLYKTLQAVDFNSRFHAGVVAIRRGDKKLTGQLDKIPLRVGDALVLAVDQHFFRQRSNDRNFHIISHGQNNNSTPLNRSKSILVGVGFLLVILLATFEILSLFKGLLILLGLFLFSGCLDLSDLQRRFPFDLFLLIGSALVISNALEQTGGAQLLGQTMLKIAPSDNAYVLLIMIFLLTYLLTEIITNNAAAALAIPIALQTAQSLNVSYLPFVMTVAFAASACFVIPFGYQTHLMVFSSGGYKVKDFVKIGWKIAICYAFLVFLLIPIVFPFYP